MSLIDTTSLTKFGDMTYSGGLNAIFDSSASTSGYAQATSGYVGVTLSEATAIASVELLPQTNGFDASGLTTSITIKLYGKQGSTPASATDGTLLGQITFTDVNSQTPRTITSNDTSTLYNHVWVYLTTGVWTALSGVSFYSEDEVIPPDAPVQIDAERYSFHKSCNSLVSLGYQFAELGDFRTELYAETPARADLFFRADVSHRWEDTGYSGAISLGAVIKYRYAEDYANISSASWTPIFNGIGGQNLCERNPQHYEKWNVFASMMLEPGYYQFTIFANAATDASGYTTTNGLAAILAEYGQGLNWFMVNIDHGAILVSNE